MNTTTANRVARATGAALLLIIAIGITASVFVADGININLNPDTQETLAAMRANLDGVYGRVHITTALTVLEVLVAAGLYRLVRERAPLVGLLSLLTSLLAAVMSLVAIASSLAIANTLASDSLGNTLDAAQLEPVLATFTITEYSAFHIGVVLNATGKAGFFWLLARARLIAAPIAWWGFAASLYIVAIMVGRDFIDALGSGAITVSFMLGNLVALVTLGAYLCFRGVRASSA